MQKWLPLLVFFVLFLFFYMLSGEVLAQEPTALETLPVTEVVSVDSEEVPDAGSWGDRLLGWQERLQTIFTRSEEHKAELEELFAARREAQLERLEALPDSDPRKADLIARLQERHEEHLAKMEEHHARLGTLREEILARMEEHRLQFEARKEFVEERKSERGDKQEELRMHLEEKRLERPRAVDDGRVFEIDSEDSDGVEDELRPMMPARKVMDTLRDTPPGPKRLGEPSVANDDEFDDDNDEHEFEEVENHDEADEEDEEDEDGSVQGVMVEMGWLDRLLKSMAW